jgi:hypothetical protein
MQKQVKKASRGYCTFRLYLPYISITGNRHEREGDKMPPTFTPVSDPSSLDRQQAYHALLSACPQIASDYSFINLWGWALNYGLEWAWDSQLVWIRQTIPEPVYWAPVGPWQTVDWDAALPGLPSDGPLRFIRIPERLLALWEAHPGLRCRSMEARGHWDYVHSVAELAALKGNRFHKKKNLLNQFLKKYTYRFMPFEPALVQEALSMQAEWCLWRDCESSDTLTAENIAVERVLTRWEALEGILGGVLTVEDRLVAYTVADPLSDDTVVIHFEKGCTSVTGVYQAINQMFLESLGERFDKVNREQDLDDQGLRKAKLSYQPSFLLKKYEVIFQ